MTKIPSTTLKTQRNPNKMIMQMANEIVANKINPTNKPVTINSGTIKFGFIVRIPNRHKIEVNKCTELPVNKIPKVM